MQDKNRNLRNLYLRYGDPRFVLKASFIFAAQNQKWSKDEIDEVLQAIEQKNYDEFYRALKMYCGKTREDFFH